MVALVICVFLHLLDGFGLRLSLLLHLLKPFYEGRDEVGAYYNINIHLSNDPRPCDRLAWGSNGAIWPVWMHGHLRDGRSLAVKRKVNVPGGRQAPNRTISMDNTKKWAFYIFENDIFLFFWQCRWLCSRNSFRHAVLSRC
jgi:hypothetical protein